MGLFTKAILVGVGAFSLAQEKAAVVIDNLAKRGQKVERRPLRDVVEWAQKAESGLQKFQETVRRGEDLLRKIKPASADQVESLSKEVAELRKMMASRAR